MQPTIKLPFLTLSLMISFAAVNAVLFTPALPEIRAFFSVSSSAAQNTVTVFLLGVMFGQIIYGPLANRLGRKPTLYIGISLQVISSLLCAFSSFNHSFTLLLTGRFLLALGSGVGLIMAFTLVDECYSSKIANEKMSYLMLSFAILPSCGIALGGMLNNYYGWVSCFYACAIYGILLLVLILKLPETCPKLDINALKIKNLLSNYATQFKDIQLIMGGALMGLSVCFLYTFSTLGPFVAIDLFHMSPMKYGIANFITPIGLVLGSLATARLVKMYSMTALIKLGIAVIGLGVLIMLLAYATHQSVMMYLFIPTIPICFGTRLIFVNTSTIAMSHTDDKSNGSAVMSFFYMVVVTLIVLGSTLLEVKKATLIEVYVALSVAMVLIYPLAVKEPKESVVKL